MYRLFLIAFLLLLNCNLLFAQKFQYRIDGARKAQTGSIASYSPDHQSYNQT
jgi:hypothetical protein